MSELNNFEDNTVRRSDVAKPCRHYVRGGCALGSKCRFDHPPPCPNYLQYEEGKHAGCPLGDDCPYAHPGQICKNKNEDGKQCGASLTVKKREDRKGNNFYLYGTTTFHQCPFKKEKEKVDKVGKVEKKSSSMRAKISVIVGDKTQTFHILLPHGEEI